MDKAPRTLKSFTSKKKAGQARLFIEIKSEVVEKIRNGGKVLAVANEYGIKEATVRTWLVRDTEGGASEALELSRLRRENEQLYRIVGQLTYESELHKKNKRRERR